MFEADVITGKETSPLAILGAKKLYAVPAMTTQISFNSLLIPGIQLEQMNPTEQIKRDLTKDSVGGFAHRRSLALIQPTRKMSLTQPLPGTLYPSGASSKANSVLKVFVVNAHGIAESGTFFCKISFDVEAFDYLAMKNVSYYTEYINSKSANETLIWKELINIELCRELPQECQGSLILQIWKKKGKKDKNERPTRAQEEKSVLLASAKYSLKNLISSDKFNLLIPLESTKGEEGAIVEQNGKPSRTTSAIILTLLYQDQYSSHFREALEKGSLQIVKQYLQFGFKADSNLQNEETPATIAAANGNVELLNYLESQGARLDLPSQNSPLDCAIKNNQLEMVSYILHVGAPIHVSSADGISPLERFISNPLLSSDSSLCDALIELHLKNTKSQRPFSELFRLSIKNASVPFLTTLLNKKPPLVYNQIPHIFIYHTSNADTIKSLCTVFYEFFKANPHDLQEIDRTDYLALLFVFGLCEDTQAVESIENTGSSPFL